jgi:hypothetical protein
MNIQYLLGLQATNGMSCKRLLYMTIDRCSRFLGGIEKDASGVPHASALG